MIELSWDKETYLRKNTGIFTFKWQGLSSLGGSNTLQFKFCHIFITYLDVMKYKLFSPSSLVSFARLDSLWIVWSQSSQITLPNAEMTHGLTI